ncbi:MAG: HAD-IA family hydrolase [Fimbriiglobus sp.]|jgi:putative hydrolase of the HAD superfamily|nr:HAD-IA family hydrolase [Fimbriiglobus sp.]
MRTIFFDFGNVIAFFDHQRAVAKLSAFTPLLPAELTLALYGGVLEEDYECGRIGTAEYIRLGARDGQLSCSPEEFEAAFVDIFTRNPEVCNLIPRLKPKYRLVLASNTNDAHYRRYTEQFADVLSHFDARCPSHHAGSRKPHTDYFAYCQLHTPHPPAECVFVDDYPSNVEAARRHGWQAVLYRPGENLAGQLRGLGVEIE